MMENQSIVQNSTEHHLNRGEEREQRRERQKRQALACIMATPPRNSGGFGVNTNRHQRLNPDIYLSNTAAHAGKGKTHNNNDGDGDDDDDHYRITISGGGQKDQRLSSAQWSSLRSSTERNVSLLSGLGLAKLCFRSVAFATITLYVLNQKHMLPKPLGMVVSRVLFWPTMPITVSRRIGKWTTVVDNAVVLGGAPFGFLNYPEKLHSQFRVTGVVNMCEEYQGPVKSYRRLGIEHLRLPTVDHFEPSVEDLKKAVSFIQRHESKGGRVYVHCRAGHGRSAAAVYAWLLYKEPLADPIELNEKLCALRNVRKYLYSQPNVNVFRRWLQEGGMVSDSDDEVEFTWPRKKQTKEPSHQHRPWNDSTRSKTGSGYAKRGNMRFHGHDSESDGDIYPASSLGRVFSDEDSSEDDWGGDDEYYDYSEDEF
jgi:atypical dual specificity phosphatase